MSSRKISSCSGATASSSRQCQSSTTGKHPDRRHRRRISPHNRSPCTRSSRTTRPRGGKNRKEGTDVQLGVAGRTAAPAHDDSALEIDHIVSLEFGGANDIANLPRRKRRFRPVRRPHTLKVQLSVEAGRALERPSVMQDFPRRAEEPLDPALFEGRLFRDHEPGVAVDREYISDLRRPMLAVADALATARALHDDFVDRHCSWAGPDWARPGSRRRSAVRRERPFRAPRRRRPVPCSEPRAARPVSSGRSSRTCGTLRSR